MSLIGSKPRRRASRNGLVLSLAGSLVVVVAIGMAEVLI
jgi:hypothetical protein